MQEMITLLSDLIYYLNNVLQKGEYDNMQIFTFEVCQQVCNKVIFKQLELAIGKGGRKINHKK